ncbi:MipA/OmpV family protein [Pseudoduganella violacea]|uniref:Outer membrane scaffolding protein for murein synthesis (MipA/OmpV family) n=1 Tax=Pseudoduganella violacea TaxID=1715466 RepID=A0A7W5FWU5_9BURK|nr:MipA/OmpV family protein [Pseudoduganella violacea]MBB3122254.1 outer membrane scaffolding protein for murein synthesis (MipA/OmpV family) [Pseudoduganella violacea]
MTSRIYLKRGAAVLLTLPALLAPSAQAEEAKPGNVLTLGGGVAVGPRYSGSDENQVGPVLGIDYAMANGFYASTLRGLGYGRSFDKLNLNAGIGVRGERKEKDTQKFGGSSGSPKLRGMGDIKASATALFGASYAIAEGFEISTRLELPISHRENGKTLNIGASGVLYNQGRDTVTLSASTSFGDAKYNQTYYGVSAVQAAHSGYRAYKPKSGLYEAEIGVSWERKLGKNWGVTTMLGATTLLGDAKNSPIVFRKTSPTGAVYASYSY